MDSATPAHVIARERDRARESEGGNGLHHMTDDTRRRLRDAHQAVRRAGKNRTCRFLTHLYFKRPQCFFLVLVPHQCESNLFGGIMTPEGHSRGS